MYPCFMLCSYFHPPKSTWIFFHPKEFQRPLPATHGCWVGALRGQGRIARHTGGGDLQWPGVVGAFGSFAWCISLWIQTGFQRFKMVLSIFLILLMCCGSVCVICGSCGVLFCWFLLSRILGRICTSRHSSNLSSSVGGNQPHKNKNSGCESSHSALIFQSKAQVKTPNSQPCRRTSLRGNLLLAPSP